MPPGNPLTIRARIGEDRPFILAGGFDNMTKQLLKDVRLLKLTACAEDELLVRARRDGDIQKVFPDAKVIRSTDSDYLYRAVLPRTEVANAIAAQIRNIDYGNFKSSVKDDALHHAYLEVWHTMAGLQSPPPYSMS